MLTNDIVLRCRLAHRHAADAVSPAGRWDAMRQPASGADGCLHGPASVALIAVVKALGG
jgi:hypothetical protein